MANQIEAYIRAAARARNIDEDIAVRVARGEGGLNDPYRRGQGPAPKSQRFGGTEHSFGPLQLYISGSGAGLGDRALAAGVDPRKDWKGGINFALDEVNRDGWRQWYGAKNVGVGRWDGITNKGTTLSHPLAGNRAPPITETTVVGDMPIAAVAGTPDTPVVADTATPEGFLSAIAKDTEKGDKGSLATLAAAFGGGSSGQDAQAQAHAAPIQSMLPALESADMTRMQMASQMMQSLLANSRKRYGTTINSAPQIGVI